MNKAEAEKAADSIFEIATLALKDEGEFVLPGFGAFRVAERAARQGRNPRTNEPISIPTSRTVKFAPYKVLKDKINS